MDELRKYITIIEAQEHAYRVQLPISLDGADPVLSSESMDFHFNTLHKGYVDKALSGEGGDFAIAGAQLHNLWHQQMQEASSGKNPPVDAALNLILDKFGSYEAFKSAFKEEALGIQGSGWCYLSTNGIIKTINNHKLASDVAVIIDMWEHAFYLDYGPNKSKYLDNIWKIIDWRIVSARIN